jgi:hypothetical protein
VHDERPSTAAGKRPQQARPRLREVVGSNGSRMMRGDLNEEVQGHTGEKLHPKQPQQGDRLDAKSTTVGITMGDIVGIDNKGSNPIHATKIPPVSASRHRPAGGDCRNRPSVGARGRGPSSSFAPEPLQQTKMAPPERDHFIVDVIGAYSILTFTRKTPEELARVIALTGENRTRRADRPELFIRDLKQRLGTAKIDELVAAYEAGQTTLQLMATHNISKTGVLALLASRSVTMRHQPMTTQELEEATKLYATGLSLKTLSKQLSIPPRRHSPRSHRCRRHHASTWPTSEASGLVPSMTRWWRSSIDRSLWVGILSPGRVDDAVTPEWIFSTAPAS